MNDEAKLSLCWNCKHGICIKETEQELMMPMEAPQKEREVKEIWEAADEKPPQDMMPIAIEQDRIKAICFWRPPHIKDAPPILVANVKQCSRFEKKDV
jgi:hypothetical protein